MKNKYKNGFTLVEMLVVISLMAILLTLVLVNAKKQKMRARNNVRIADIQTLRLAIEDYKLACGEYPAWIGEDANNGCQHGEYFSDFLPQDQIPVNPNHSNPQWYDYITSSGIDDSDGYLYAGLSTSINGKCYDYHIGVELEVEGITVSIIDTDHDARSGTGKYKYKCRNSNPDFDGRNQKDDERGLYDLRSNSVF